MFSNGSISKICKCPLIKQKECAWGTISLKEMPKMCVYLFAVTSDLYRIQKKLVKANSSGLFECHSMLSTSLCTWLPPSRCNAVVLTCLMSPLQWGSWNGAPGSLQSHIDQDSLMHVLATVTSVIVAQDSTGFFFFFLATKSWKPSFPPDKGPYRRPYWWSRSLGLDVSRVGKLTTSKVASSLLKQLCILGFSLKSYLLGVPLVT